MNARLPNNEAERLAALKEYRILDTGTEQSYDDITALAAHICQVPMAMISLVDEARQWFKSRIGSSPAANAARDRVLRAYDSSARAARGPGRKEGRAVCR